MSLFAVIPQGPFESNGRKQLSPSSCGWVLILSGQFKITPQVAAKILEVIKVPQIDDFPMPRDATISPQDSDGIEDYGSPDQSGDHARRVPTDFTHRQVCRSACGVAAMGPSYSDGEQTVDQLGDQACFIPADTAHRQGYCRYACGNTVEVPPAKFVGTVVEAPVTLQINQVTKRVEIPRTLFVDKVVDIPVGMIRQVPQFQTVLKTGKVLQVQLMSVCKSRSPGGRDSAACGGCNDRFFSFKLW